MKMFLNAVLVGTLCAGCASTLPAAVALDAGKDSGASPVAGKNTKPSASLRSAVTTEVERFPKQAPVPNVTRYRLGKGDVFSINVFNEPDLSKAKIRMSDAGTIQFISLGEVVVEGMSVPELEALVTKSLKGSYLTDPKVIVTIDEYRPVFLAGQVAKTGTFPYQPGLTVIRAITIAGGFAPRADEKKLYIQKENNPGQLILVGPNSYVEPGDIVTVGESFF